MTSPPPGASPSWTVEPSGPLRGEVRVSGSKNAITKHMVAAIMGSSPSTITNVPDVGDVVITTEVLESLGVGVDLDGDTVIVSPADELRAEVPVRYSGLNRIPILLLGPLLHLRHEVFVPVVGGDRIGARPVDFHVEALRAFGAEVQETEDGVRAKVVNRLKRQAVVARNLLMGKKEEKGAGRLLKSGHKFPDFKDEEMEQLLYKLQVTLNRFNHVSCQRYGEKSFILTSNKNSNP